MLLDVAGMHRDLDRHFAGVADPRLNFHSHATYLAHPRRFRDYDGTELAVDIGFIVDSELNYPVGRRYWE
jgi:hypothetical protein